MTGTRAARGEPPRTCAPVATTGGWARTSRGAVVGTVAVLLALTGHLLAGGAQPGSPWLLGVAGVSVATAVALSRRRWETGTLLGFLLVAQVSFHAFFEGAARTGHDVFVGASGSSMASMGGRAMTTMVAAHVVAAVVTAWVLRHGEDSVWTLLEHVGRPVLLALTPLVLPAVPDLPGTCDGRTVDLLPRARCLLAHPRRGPPATRR